MARILLPRVTTRSPLVTAFIGFSLGVLTTMLFISMLALQSEAPSHQLLEIQSIQRVAAVSCDQSLEKLKRLAKIALYRGQLTVNTSCFTDSTPSIPRANVTELRQFLYPSKDQLTDTRRDGVPLGTPQKLNQEYLQRKNLLIGVLTQQEYLRTRAKAVYETWSADVDDVVFFVGEDCNITADISHLPILKLPGIPDHVYPPLRKAFAVLQYMYDHYITNYNWFIRADDDMYVRGQKLQELLHELNPFEKVYMGRAGVGRDEDMGRLRLLPHERYCMGGPGVIFSNAAMRGLGPHLNNCLEAVFYHDKHAHNGDWNDDDVEIGRCLSRKLDVQCSTSEESRQFFKTDYGGDSLNPLLLWTKKQLAELITLHPVKNPDNMRSIHHFYKTLDFEMMYEELYNLSASINTLCRSLPPHLSPPLFASPGCNLNLEHHRADNRSVTSSNTAGSYITAMKQSSFHNPSNQYDLAHWKTFTSYYEFEASPTAPQHVLYPSFKAEITHLMKLVQAYFNANSQKSIQIEDILEGYSRFNPSTGREYILHLKYSELDHPDSVKHTTLRLLRSLSPAISVSEIEYIPQTVHLILPLETVDDQLLQFLLMYQEEGLSHHQKLHLVMVVFNSLNAASAEKITQSFGFHDAQITIVRGEGNFSFVHAIEIGMDVVKKSNDLVFITNIDMRIKYQFYRRCRLHTVLGKSTYYPIPFNLYSTDHTFKKEATVVPHVFHWTGQWSLHTFDSLCIHKQDYKNLGQFEGSSSLHLFEQIIKSSLELIQAPDPAVTQIWSSKACSSLKENSLQQDVCQQLRQAALFDKTDLAEYLVELSEKRNNPIVFGSLADRGV